MEEKKTLSYWASDIARDEMPEPVVIHLDSDDDDFATDTTSENEDERTSDTLIGYLPIFQMLPKFFLCIRYRWYSFEYDA